MKKHYLLACWLFLAGWLAGCDYLDVVPDERVKQNDLYQTPDRMKALLYSCYGYLPLSRSISNNSYWLICGAEISFYRKELFSTFNEGTYSPSSLHMTTNTWGTVWQGIRQCYTLLSLIDQAPNLVEEDRIRYKAEATFLIAYYHFISLQAYGPTICIDRLYDQNEPVENIPERSTYDETVAFIDRKIDEAMPGLAGRHEANDYGRATQFAAWAVKSRMYLYAASPLFNGNREMYGDFKSKLDGRFLIAQEYDEKKWEKSAQVSKAAIDQAEAAGFRLYSDQEAGTPDGAKPGLPDKAQRRIRYCILDYAHNPEVLWADPRKETTYDLQNRSAPRQVKNPPYGGANGIAPMLQTVERFYTRNGLPIDEDKTFDYEGRYSVVEMPACYDGNNYSSESNGTTMKQHLNREPRFYAWIGFHNGFTEISRYNGATTGGGRNDKKAVLLKMRAADDHGQQGKSVYYSVTGYLNKKFLHPAYQTGPVHYPFCLFRMAELYLNYAEALVELNRLDEAKEYIDRVRERAGIPAVDDAWNTYSRHPGYQNTQAGMREIVRRERQLEFYLEGQRFWDIRRWKIAERYLGVPDKGLNVGGASDEEFFQVAEVPLERHFHRGQYLMPIDVNEINRLPQLVQNPFYGGK